MQKIGESDKKLFGEFAIVASGFSKDERKDLMDIANQHSKELKVIFAAEKDGSLKLKELFSKEHNYGFLNEEYPKKAVIMSGFLEKELIDFMKSVKSAGLNPKLWAVLTQTSNDWKLCDLLDELEKEAEAMKEIPKQKSSQP